MPRISIKIFHQVPYCSSVYTQVWRAHCKTYDEVVAIKLLDLESVNCSLVGYLQHFMDSVQ